MAMPKELLDQGNLDDAINAATTQVKTSPSDARVRTFLFELLCFAGRYDEAAKQLDVIGHQDAASNQAVQIYLNNLKAEQDRARLFSEGLEPHFLFDPPNYVEAHLEAINLVRDGRTNEARQILDHAEEQRPAVSGSCVEQLFSDFRDANDLTAPVLELFMNGKYVWLPLESIESLEVTPPARLRDLIWTTATIETSTGMNGEVFIPALYARSAEQSSDAIKLGRMTDWLDLGDGVFQAVGLRVFTDGVKDTSLFELKSLNITTVESQQAIEAVNQR